MVYYMIYNYVAVYNHIFKDYLMAWRNVHNINVKLKLSNTNKQH